MEFRSKVMEKDWSELSAIITRLLTSEHNYGLLGIFLVLNFRSYQKYTNC